jgi:hypothetical protein
MCDTCHTHGPLSAEAIVCRATPEQILRLLRDIYKTEGK